MFQNSPDASDSDNTREIRRVACSSAARQSIVQSGAMYWEIATASSLLLAGTELMILYHPEAVAAMKEKIVELSA